MNGSIRRRIVFSDHASVSLFECLIVAGAPATGLLQETGFKEAGTLQMTLQLLRDMWQRADTLYIPRADLESLHNMEYSTTVSQDRPIPDQIALETRKLSRYYIYLLFCYCMSSAAPMTYNQQGFTGKRDGHMSPWEPKKTVAPLVDVPGSWLDSKVCTNYPSAPPIPEGNFMSVFPNYHHHQQQPQQQPPQSLESHRYPPTQQQNQQSPKSLENHRYPAQRPPHQIGEYQREMNYTKLHDQPLPLHRNNKQLYTDPNEQQLNEPSRNKPFKGPDHKAKKKSVFSTGCYDSNVDSEDEY